MRISAFLLAAAALLAGSGTARADEGMWTFDAFPTAAFRQAYGWAPDQAWLDRTRAAAVRLTGGCSASFVSSAGLILTNQHCVEQCLSDLSSAATDYNAIGFIARSRPEEKKCAGQQAEVVTGIEDVTPRVKGAIGAATGEAAVKARTAAIATIEQAGCTDLAKTRCQVVSLYGGGQYKLYRYRKYSDVRLAWSPETAAQAFGGDPDNYNFPRFALDGAFLRAYENGKPAATPRHLRWTARAPVTGETVFVVGNPGSTQRMLTRDEYAYQREVNLPVTIAVQSELRGRLLRAMREDPAKAREGASTLFGIENNLKRSLGRQRALLDPGFNAMLDAREAALRQRSAGAPGIGDPWSEVSTAMRAFRDIALPWRFATPDSDLFDIALSLVRAGDERARPNPERLPDFTDSALPLLEKQLLDERPFYPWLEELTLDWSLSKTREYLGPDHPQSALLLGKEAPETRAARLVQGTKLADPAVRRALWQGGKAAILASTDPMIVYARAIDANARRLKAIYDERVDGPLTAARARLADARFAAYGDSVTPDATSSLRITFGKVGGWTENGQLVPDRTDWAGAFARATGQAPFALADEVLAARTRLDLAGPLNFAYATDTIGGNSGSPVIDREGRVIGANFDRNMPGLRNDYAYDSRMARSIGVSTAALDQALRVVYPAPALLAELYAR